MSGVEPVNTDAKSPDVGDKWRDALWQATDSIVKVAEGIPDLRASTNMTLIRLGEMIDDIDDRYFAQYQNVTTTLDYGKSLAAMSNTLEGVLGKGVKAAGSGSKTKPDVKSVGEKTAEAKDQVVSAVSEAPKVASAPEGGKSTTAEAVVKTVGEAADAVKAAVADASTDLKKDTVSGAKASAAVSPATSETDLDRTPEVQQVVENVQSKAVQYYKSASTAAATVEGVPEGVKAPLSQDLHVFEAKLESLLGESKFKPRKLKKNRKSELVQAIADMEASYPADASPLKDPDLSGQWVLVYSSSSRILGRALRGVLLAFFKTYDRRQVVDAKSRSVLNACRARLRMTPWGLPVAKKGDFRTVSERKVMVDMPPTKKGLLRRFLPTFRSGKIEADITYLSKQWRICRSGGATFAFRKSDGGGD